jgi:predicted AAA+ superfamily ATPase
MDDRFLAQNSHLDDANLFSERDPDLRQMKSQKYPYQFAVMDQFPIDTPGIYTLCGTHRSGKTTLLKSWMKNLLEKDIFAKTIYFFSCDQIENYHNLQKILQKQIENSPRDSTLYFILDNITSIRDWEKAIKPLVNSGVLSKTALMLSSSESTLKNTVQTHFSETRGKARHIDFQIYPLSFGEAVRLKHGPKPEITTLYEEFNQYLIHGGYLGAINEIAEKNHLSAATFKSFTDWLRKDFEKRGKQERYLHEILAAILKHYNEQITWNALAQELTIDHPKTIGDYLADLESLDMVFVQYALLEDSLTAAPKKARKLMFTDPFIFHAINAWISSQKNNVEIQIKNTLSDAELSSKLVDSCVISHFKRFFPTFYIKSEGEVDLAYVHNQRFWPIEITWASQLRAKDLKQILKYSNGRILTKTERSGIIQQIKTEPLALALWQLEQNHG